MEWKYDIMPEMRLYVKERRFNEETAGCGIPAFYKEFKEECSQWIKPRYGICKSPDEHYDWVYALGDVADGECPEGFSEITIVARGYAIFYGKSAAEINRFIYGEWFLLGQYEIVPGDIVEVYDDEGNVVEIRVPANKMRNA